MLTGWKSRMRGYRLRGDSVPLVMTTDRNLLNTGRIAKLASRQLQDSSATRSKRSTVAVRRHRYRSMHTQPILRHLSRSATAHRCYKAPTAST